MRRRAPAHLRVGPQPRADVSTYHPFAGNLALAEARIPREDRSPVVSQTTASAEDDKGETATTSENCSDFGGSETVTLGQYGNAFVFTVGC